MNLKGRLSDLTLKTKITGLVALLLTVMAGAGAYALNAMSMINAELVSIAEEDIPLTKALMQVTAHQLEQAASFEQTLRYGEVTKAEDQAAAFASARSAFDRFSNKVAADLRKSDEIIQSAMAEVRDEAALAEFQKVADQLTALEAQHKKYDEHILSVIALIEAHKLDEAARHAEQLEIQKEQINHALESLLAEVEGFTDHAAKAAEAHEQHAHNVMYVVLGLSLLAGMLLAWWVIRNAVRRIQYAVSVAETVAAGDLRNTVEANSSDEIGRLLAALGTMRDNLHRMVAEMHESSNGLAVAAEELSTATNQMSSSVESQRAELVQASTAFTEMTATVQEVAHNAGTTAESTVEANQTSLAAKQVIDSAIRKIQGLAASVDSAGEVIARLGSESEAIGAVIDVIKGIAEQTNLLALNAAIEAARAGEQGRGFAVVADEVRTLAQRTQESTQEIEEMIERLQTSARSAVQRMEGGRGQARESVEEAGKAGEALDRIVGGIHAINGMNAQIASAAEEQTVVSDDINRNLTSISEAAEQNASAMTQTSGASDELARMAASLQAMIGRFQVA